MSLHHATPPVPSSNIKSLRIIKMRIATSLATLALSIPCLADFHIGRADKQTNPFSKDFPVINWTDYTVCPSNYFGCQCYGGLKATSGRGVSTKGNKPPTGDFSINAGLCGVGQLDFYYRANENKWEFYIDNGNGQLQGTCYPNNGHDLCSLRTGTVITVNYYEELVCYTKICD